MSAATGNTEIIVAGMLFAVAALVTAARVLNVPYPIFLVVGGLGIGLMPGLAPVELDPDLVLLIFLPPLLYSAALFASLRELRANLQAISLLAIGLVLATCAAVAVVAHALIPTMSWPAAFVLGAIVSPTDPVAATAIASRLGVPRRVVTIVEGESLINDATGLVAYKVAVAAVVTGTFSGWDASAEFLYSGLGGAAMGLGVGWIVAQVRVRLHDPPVEVTISLLTGYAAYLPAEELGLSGVIAAVAVGLYMGSQTSRVTDATVRMTGNAVWQILVFLLNSFLFVLIGLQLPTVLEQLRGENYTTGDLLTYAGAVCVTVIVIRLVWSYAFTYLPPLVWGKLRMRGAPPSPRNVALVGWMGLRGAVSLAAALALPTQADGGPFDERAVILFIAFSVILATLVVQGLSLPAVIRLLKIEPDDAHDEEEARARLQAAEAALERIESLADQEWTHDDSVERLRRMYDYRRNRFAARFDESEDAVGYEARSIRWTQMMLEVIDAQREAIERMRVLGEISDDVMRTVERDLDLEENRLAEAREP